MADDGRTLPAAPRLGRGMIPPPSPGGKVEGEGDRNNERGGGKADATNAEEGGKVDAIDAGDGASAGSKVTVRIPTDEFRVL